MFLVHHIFLPAKLPQVDDNALSLDRHLIGHIKTALQHLNRLLPVECAAIDDAVTAYQSFLDSMSVDFYVDARNLEQLFERMASQNTGTCL